MPGGWWQTLLSVCGLDHIARVVLCYVHKPIVGRLDNIERTVIYVTDVLVAASERSLDQAQQTHQQIEECVCRIEALRSDVATTTTTPEIPGMADLENRIQACTSGIIGIHEDSRAVGKTLQNCMDCIRSMHTQLDTIKHTTRYMHAT